MKKKFFLFWVVGAVLLSSSFGEIKRYPLVPEPAFRTKFHHRERAGLAFAPEGIFALTSRGWMSLINPEGKILWQKKSPCTPSATPLIFKGKFFYPCQEGIMVCGELESGEELWRFEFKDSSASTPAVREEFLVFQTGQGWVYALNKDSGELVWIQRLNIGGNRLSLLGASQPVIDENRVFIASRLGVIASFELKTGEILWKKEVFKDYLLSDLDYPLLSDSKTIYPVSGVGICALSKKTGNVFWSVKEPVLASAKISSGYIYLLNQDFELLKIDAQVGLVEERIDLSEKKKLAHQKLLEIFPLERNIVFITSSRIYSFEPASEELKLIKKYPGRGQKAWLEKGKIYLLSSKGYLLEISL